MAVKDGNWSFLKYRYPIARQVQQPEIINFQMARQLNPDRTFLQLFHLYEVIPCAGFIS
jgi:hypothetical protein